MSQQIRKVRYYIEIEKDIVIDLNTVTSRKIQLHQATEHILKLLGKSGLIGNKISIDINFLDDDELQ